VPIDTVSQGDLNKQVKHFQIPRDFRLLKRYIHDYLEAIHYSRSPVLYVCELAFRRPEQAALWAKFGLHAGNTTFNTRKYAYNYTPYFTCICFYTSRNKNILLITGNIY
jgi:hypothetical protein